jgi:uncharacterized membrane protein YeaQ/YmgE (transglycosylase-associated protein family)
MKDLIVQMGPMSMVAGLAAGWLAAAVMPRRGYGLLVDLGLGVGASMLGGVAFLALAGAAPGTLVISVIGFGMASVAIFAQRLGWPCDRDAHERRARRRLTDLRGPGRAAAGAASGLAGAGDGTTGWPTPKRALARLATTGIYMLSGIPIEVQRAARVRAAREATTVRNVLLTVVAEYGAGTWTPQPHDPARIRAVPRHTRVD